MTGPGEYQSGQMGQTVNLLAYAFGGSNPSSPTQFCGSSSVDRASAFQAEGRGFEPRLPLYDIQKILSLRKDFFVITHFYLCDNKQSCVKGFDTALFVMW